LAQLVPPVAVRLRRDLKTVLTLIRAHALLHQASRLKDEAGRVVATIEDYSVVRSLVADLIAEGVDVTVKPEIREVVETTARLLTEGLGEVRQTNLSPVLNLDKSAISRRVAGALSGGFLKNLEDRKGRPARLVMGDPLPANREVLPLPDRLHGCVIDLGDTAPPPPPAEIQLIGLVEASQEALPDEHAAIEYDGGAPRVWAEALARLDPACPPRDISPERWLRIIDDWGRFLDDGWAKEASRFGWWATDIFGVHPTAPSCRYDQMGLVPLINGGKVISITERSATIQSPGGSRLVYMRRPSGGGVALWELAGR
jgi:hypothetical protein